jgi:hypothetical protein
MRRTTLGPLEPGFFRTWGENSQRYLLPWCSMEAQERGGFQGDRSPADVERGRPDRSPHNPSKIATSNHRAYQFGQLRRERQRSMMDGILANHTLRDPHFPIMTTCPRRFVDQQSSFDS